MSDGGIGFFFFFFVISPSFPPPDLPFFFFAASCEHGRRGAWPFSLCPWLITLFSGVLVSFSFSRSFALFLFYCC